MVGKTVRIKDPYLLKFFYPDFQVKEELTYADRDAKVIYVGKSRRDLREYLSSNTKQFINTVGAPDMDFNNKEKVVEWAFEKKGKVPTTKILEQVKNIDDEYFLYLLKIYWVTARWVGESSDSEVSVFNLFVASTSSLKQALQIYFALIDEQPARVVESSFITFLSRIHNIEDQSVSPGYLKLLKSALNKYGPKVKPAVYKLALRHDSREEFAFIDLLTDLR